MNSVERHYKNLECLIFASGGPAAPPWLNDSVRDCQRRYAGIALTDQFKTAVNSFEDGDTPKPFELFVVGEGKFGKSTLVNCLLGEEQSKVRGLPETRCFLRYVVTDTPNDTARMYLRTQKGVHDWILSQVGKGRSVKELYEILEYTVELKRARILLDGELERLDRGNYDPAIYELERDVRRSQQSTFKNPIRVVDTQGLDQLFPDELKQSTKGLSDETTTERFIQWMNSSPRGKHLEWQFRRCDAVLWCVNAKRIGSASTVASLRYFSNYSKKIIIALTNIDIAKNEQEKLRLLDAASKKYSGFSNRIVPVNGLSAWHAVTGKDDQLLKESGFTELVDVLVEVCEVEGIKVRNMARYSGLRETESQYRLVLRALAQDYGELLTKYESDTARIKVSLEKDLDLVQGNIVRSAKALARDIRARIRGIEFRDDQSIVDKKLSIHIEVAKFSSIVMGEIDKRILPNVASQAQLTTAYRLPAFDADGKRAGHKFSVNPEPMATAIAFDLPYFKFDLGDWFDNAVDWLDEKFGWVAGGGDASDKRRADRLQERQWHLAQVFESEWKRQVSSSCVQVKNETIRQYEAVLDAIESVFKRIEVHAGGSVSDAKHRIHVALEGIAVPPVFQSQVLGAVSRMSSGKFCAVSGQSSSKVTASNTKSYPPTSLSHVAPTHSSSSRQTLQVGARVVHRILGQGNVLEVTGGYYIVKFESESFNRKFNEKTIRDPDGFVH